MVAPVKLKNGTEVPDVAVGSTMIALRTVLGENPIAFYELVCVCKDPSHQPFGNSGQALEAIGLLQPGGKPHDVVRDIVLSAVTVGDSEFDLTLNSPVA